MKPALIQVVRNDTDILFNNWTYYYNIGIRDFYVMLHLPSTEHFEIIEEFKDWFTDINFNFAVNSSKSHYHERDAHILINDAIKDGIRWIIASDADELLILKRHNSINEFLSQYDDSPAILCFRWLDYHGDCDVAQGKNAFIEMQYSCTNFMDSDDPNWKKCCGYFNDTMRYIPGFHNITGCEKIINIDSDTAYYAHFPDRNYEQYKEKILIQHENWLDRYGYFYSKENLTDEYIKFLWANRIITLDGQRQVCNSDKYNSERKIYYKHDPINQRLFQL